MNKKMVLVLVIAVVAIGVGAFAWYFFSQASPVKQAIQRPPATEKKDAKVSVVADTLGAGDIGQATDNPLENMPSTNPLEDVANPFRDAYKNPFK